MAFRNFEIVTEEAVYTVEAVDFRIDGNGTLSLVSGDGNVAGFAPGRWLAIEQLTTEK